MIPGPLHTRGSRLIDSQGRVVILRGANYSGRHKQPPFLIDDPAPLARLARWGFNALRLVLVWEALEPRPGQVDAAFLDRVEALCQRAGELGLHVIVDLHQDIYGRLFGGSGAPDWTVAPADRQSPAGPSSTWFMHYMTDPRVRRSLDRFWRNDEGLQDHLVRAVVALARRLRTQPAVVGWELYNEPFPGNHAFTTFEAQRLEPFYRRFIEAVRRVAPHWVAFFEGTVITSEARLGLDLGGVPNLVYCPHFYCKHALAAGRYDGDDRELRATLAVYQRDAAARDIPWMLGEYGLPHASAGARRYMRHHQRALERHQVGGTFWHYNPTAQHWNDERMSVVLPDGAASPMLDALAHPYPMAVAGEPLRYGFDQAERRFELAYTADQPGADTVIALPRRCYPQGASAEVKGGRCAQAPGADLLVVRGDTAGGQVLVTVAPRRDR